MEMAAWIPLFILAVYSTRGMAQPVSCGGQLDGPCTCYLNPELDVICKWSNMSDLVTLPTQIAGRNEINTLQLSHCHLRELHTNIFHNLCIKHLYLSNNELGLHGDPFQRISFNLEQRKSLLSLSLSYNHLTHIPEVIEHLPNLQVLGLAGNNISTEITAKCTLPGNLTNLFLGNLKTFPFQLSSQLKMLQFTPEPVGSINEMMEDLIPNLSHLVVLTLNAGDYNIDPGSILTNLPSLQHFEAKHCVLGAHQLNVELPHEMSNLWSLALENVSLEIIPEKLLRKLPSLIGLYLYRNNIEFVNFQSFIHNPKLEHLDLSRNSISYIESGSLHLLEIVRIDLSYNRLTCISNDIFPEPLPDGMNLMAGGNPLVCDCDNWWFMKLVNAQHEGSPGPLVRYEIHETLMCLEPLSQRKMLVHEAYTLLVDESHVTC